MIARRALPLLLAAPAVAAAAARADYQWRVLRNGSEIGTHNVTFTQRGDEVSALSDLAITPRVMGVVVYRFEHRYTEVTRGGLFVQVQSRLNHNGRTIEVEAAATPQGVALLGPEGALILPRGAAPLSWWEPQRFGGGTPLFGTTTGKPMDLRWAREALPGGGTRWRTSGEVEAVLDFDAGWRWIGYQVKAEDGNDLSYRAA